MTVLELACGHWRAGVIPEEGANLTWLTYQGQDVLRSRAAALAAGGGLPLYGEPILFPANRNRDGTFCFRGRMYCLPINEPTRRTHLHGLVMRRAFQVFQVDSQKIELRYESISEDYPFPFALTVRCGLTEQGLERHFLLENRGNEDFPAVFGLHTTFVQPSFLQVPLEYAQLRDERFLPIGKDRPLSPEEKSWSQGALYQGEPLSEVYTAAGRTAQIGRFVYQVSDLFHQWMLYSGGKGFICVEPLAGQIDGLNNPKGYLLVPQGGALEFHTTISQGANNNE